MRIEHLLGRGAMGEVYRAIQVSLRRLVAVKRIASPLLDDEQAVARFTREAQCLARQQSRHIVSIYDFGTLCRRAGRPALAAHHGAGRGRTEPGPRAQRAR